MKATDVIKRDHDAAKALFERYKEAGTDDERSRIEREIFMALTAHENMEDEHFYPALMDKAGKEDAELKAIDEEQGELKMDVMGMQAMETITGDRADRVQKMMEKVLAHATKEENIVFMKAQTLLGDEELERIGKEMEPDSAVAKANES